ncbi:hypothetical protein GUITHDRAFT_107984 [Guillardia theta CCMP2712]|uniref:Transmembrane protein n=1 Tax=Guillardia theta (strain CCMP2712) TaxID=905079 RepID=L1JBN6_GUITC|nr:hypothetical protein GUITHDRAFT_107984 [Guillardia theta CCMP2712]EKX45948.1 hypothetical protein GUITHDRAFT_107984 [Guillardia theta CCMP2712]|eukprot:XP_005832928.1 hypothetical protein GUITHDRAFT_107984 [Guillardia theta CCMP2712]
MSTVDDGKRSRQAQGQEARTRNGVNTMGCVVTITFMIILFLSSTATGQRQSSRDSRETMGYDPSKETLGTVSMPSMPSKDSSFLIDGNKQNSQPMRASGFPDVQNQISAPSSSAPCKCPAGNQARGGNVATAAATLGALMWAGGQIPQMSKVWKSKNAQSFSAMTLFFQLGASFLCAIYALLSGSFTLTLFSMFLFGR